MRIQNNTYKSFNFGYNQEYHNKVEDYLITRKKQKEIARFILEQDKLSLSIEDKIVELEQNPRSFQTDRFWDLVEMLLDLKSNVAFTIERHFPKLEYCKNLILNYTKENKEIDSKYNNPWRLQLCDDINKHSAIDYSSEFRSSSDDDELKNENKGSSNVTIVKSGMDNDIAYLDEKIPKIKTSDFLISYQPTVSSPKGFCDIVGLGDIKDRFQDEILSYIDNPDLAQLDFIEYGIKAPRGFLFYGPPGCGKTYITEALATEGDIKMFKMDISKIGSKYLNETASNIQEAFEFLEEVAKIQNKPVLLFMDEVDSLAIDRKGDNSGSNENSKATTTLLKLVELARDKNIVVIAATNRFDNLDEAFKSRFDNPFYLGLPDLEQISSLIKFELNKREKGKLLAKSDNEIASISKEFTGYSNRSIIFIIDEAAKIAKKDNRSNIKCIHIKEAIDKLQLEKVNENDYIKQDKNSIPIGFSE